MAAMYGLDIEGRRFELTRSAEAVNKLVHLPPAPRQMEGLKAEEVKRGEDEKTRRGGEEF